MNEKSLALLRSRIPTRTKNIIKTARSNIRKTKKKKHKHKTSSASASSVADVVQQAENYKQGYKPGTSNAENTTTMTSQEKNTVSVSIFNDKGEVKPYDQKKIGVGSNAKTKETFYKGTTIHSKESLIASSQKREQKMTSSTQTLNPLINLVSKQQIQKEKQFQEDIQQYPQGTLFIETDTGYNVQLPDLRQQRVQQKKEQIRRFYQNNPLGGFAHTWTTGVLSWEDPLGLKTLGYTLEGMITGKHMQAREKILETKARATVDLDISLEKGYKSFIMKSYTGPFSAVGTSYVSAAGVGAGIGAVKAALPTVGKITELGVGVGMSAYAVKESAPKIQHIMKTGDIGEAAAFTGMLAATAVAGYKGYKTGHAFGYGRVEAYVYRTHTYKPGSIQDIQFKHALKVARNLESVKSHKMKALDIAKDIARMDEETAAKTITFLKRHPRTTIGGSAASYTQIEGARVPQDIDLLLPGGKKSVTRAKQFFGNTKTPAGEHLIDIHGKEFYKPGGYHRFGFRSQTPVKIGEYRFFRAGEQLFRKGVAAIQKETSYRHFKDIPDFVTHAESLIKSSRLSKNPFTRIKGSIAQRHLDIYLNPGRGRVSKLGRVAGEYIRKYTRLQTVENVYNPQHQMMYYVYPKTAYPLGYTGFSMGVAYKTSSYMGNKKTLSFPYVSKIQQPKYTTISYMKKTTKASASTIPIQYPRIKKTKYPTIPYTTTPPINTNIGYPRGTTENKYIIFPSTTKRKLPEITVKNPRLKPVKQYNATPRYLYREFKIPSLQKLLGGNIP